LGGKRRVLPKEERKEELLNAAACVFAEKGYRTAGIADIIEKAGVARGTFYHYFESKKDVFLELIELYFDRFREMLEENHVRLTEALEAGSDLPGAWRDNALSILRFHHDNPELTALIFREAIGMDERFSSKVEELSKLARSRMAEEFQMVADRGLLVECDVEIVTTIVNGAMMNLVMEYVLPARDVSLEELADALVRNQLRALTPAGYRELLDQAAEQQATAGRRSKGPKSAGSPRKDV
jgi:AcrR family transcriptional regulator